MNQNLIERALRPDIEAEFWKDYRDKDVSEFVLMKYLEIFLNLERYREAQAVHDELTLRGVVYEIKEDLAGFVPVV